MSAHYRQHIFVMAVALLLAAGSATASNIYKWTDAEGTVHYGDRPAADGSSERMAIESRGTDRQQVASLVDARRESREVTQEQMDAAKSGQQSAEEQRTKAAERAAQCTKFKERLQQFVQSRRLYREDDNGERVYLDDDEMLAARNKVQQQVQEACSG